MIPGWRWVQIILSNEATGIIGFYIGRRAERRRLYPRILLIVAICAIVERPVCHCHLSQQHERHAKADARATLHRALELLALCLFMFLIKLLLLILLIFFIQIMIN